jgi:HEAT repeat protein
MWNRIPVVLLILTVGIVPAVRGQEDPIIRGRAVSEWFRLLKSEVNAARRQAILALIDSQAGPNVPIVLPNLLNAVSAHSDPAIRARILRILPKYKDRGDDIVQTYRSRLIHDSDGATREAAAQTIPKLDRSAAVLLMPDLGTALKDKDSRVRAASAQAIGMLSQGDPQVANEVLPQLRVGLHDADSEVRFQCAYALAQMGEVAAPAAGDLAEMFRTDANVLNRREAAKALGAIGSKAKDAVDALLMGLNDPQASVRQAAALALTTVRGDPDRVLPALLKSARDPDVSVRCLSIHAIGAMGKSAIPAIPVLIDILRRDEVADVRLAVIEELAHFGPDARPAIDALRIASKDGRAAVREAAQAALKKIESMP